MKHLKGIGLEYVALVVVLAFFGVWSGDWLREKWVPLVVFGLWLFIRPVFKVDGMLGAALLYTLAQGSILALYPGSYFYDFPVMQQSVLSAEALKGVVYLMALVVIFKRFLELRFIVHGLWILCLWASGLQIAAKFFDLEPVGISFNPSLSSTAVALLYPFIMKRFTTPRMASLAAWTLPISAVLYCGSAISIIAMIVGVAAFYYSSLRSIGRALGAPSWAALVVPAVVAVCGLGIAAFVMGADLFKFSGRLEFWPKIHEFLEVNPSKEFFGFGLGSFAFYGQIIQKSSIGRDWLTAHNDIIQVWFELGLFGAILWIMVFIRAADKALETPFAFAFFAILGVVSFGNFPHHMGLEAFLIAFMYCYVLVPTNAEPLSDTDLILNKITEERLCRTTGETART